MADGCRGDLRARLPDALPGRVVHPRNWHLTLAFLGPVERSAVAAIAAALEPVAAAHSSGALVLDGAGAFPNPERARVLWIGVSPSARLVRLALAVREALAEVGYPADGKPFHPHLTLSRLRSSARVGGAIARLRSIHLRCDYGGFTLFRSDSGPEGPRYSGIRSFPLRAAAADAESGEGRAPREGERP